MSIVGTLDSGGVSELICPHCGTLIGNKADILNIENRQLKQITPKQRAVWKRTGQIIIYDQARCKFCSKDFFIVVTYVRKAVDWQNKVAVEPYFWLVKTFDEVKEYLKESKK
jgi:hypothetical protein